MCGRFTLTRRDPAQLALELGVLADALTDYRPRYNIAPTDPHWIVRMKYEDREVLPARWGLVNSWAKDNKRAAQQINARAETLESRAAFKGAFHDRRCVIPADGFFEWVGPKNARQPIWFHRPDRGLLLFAGLYEYWARSLGQWERTFAIVTTDANKLVEPVHDRMPVILTDDAIDGWMHRVDGGLKHAVPAPDALRGHACPPRQPANDDPDITSRPFSSYGGR
jgi:putative SOS response-associated peptidase YedK